MKDLRLFLEHRTKDQIKIIDNKTNKELNPEYSIYDENSLQSFINKYKLNKDQFKDYQIYFAYIKDNTWVVKTSIKYQLNLGRVNDKFLSNGTIDYSYNDIVNLLDGDLMIIIIK